MKEIEAYLPLHVSTRIWKNRTVAKLELPLFPGYVFVKIAESERAKVLSVPRVYSIIGNGRGPLSIPEEVVEALRWGLARNKVSPWPHVKVGVRARVATGALAGLEGIVVRHDGNLRIVISVELIAQSVAVHVSAADIELCE